MQGVAHQLPIATASAVIAQFSMAGLPLLAGFPVHLAMWETVGRQYPWAAVWMLLGSAGLMVAGIRTLVVLLAPPISGGTEESCWKFGETRLEILLLVLGIAAFIAAGIFSQWYFPALTRLGQGLESLSP